MFTQLYAISRSELSSRIRRLMRQTVNKAKNEKIARQPTKTSKYFGNC